MKAIKVFSVVMSFAIVTLFGASTVGAQDKEKAAAPATKGQSQVKVLLDNEKFRAYESIYEPGDENKSVPTAARVVRAMTSGTLLRTYPNGKTEKIEWKEGEVRFNPPAAAKEQYTTKNVGKTKLVLYLVVAK